MRRADDDAWVLGYCFQAGEEAEASINPPVCTGAEDWKQDNSRSQESHSSRLGPALLPSQPPREHADS